MAPKPPKTTPIQGERANKSPMKIEGQGRFSPSFYIVRDERVIVDTDLAKIFVVPVSRVRKYVYENSRRFPEDFAFPLTEAEIEVLKEQGAKGIRAGKDNPPWAFTEQGVAMLLSLFTTRWAIIIGIQIIRAFKQARSE